MWSGLGTHLFSRRPSTETNAGNNSMSNTISAQTRPTLTPHNTMAANTSAVLAATYEMKCLLSMYCATTQSQSLYFQDDDHHLSTNQHCCTAVWCAEMSRPVLHTTSAVCGILLPVMETILYITIRQSYRMLEQDHRSGWVQDGALCHCSSANPIPPLSSLNTWNSHLYSYITTHTWMTQPCHSRTQKWQHTQREQHIAAGHS